MNEEVAGDLRYWLREPNFTKEQRTPINLSTEQLNIALNKTSTGYRRLKGSAGSGKSLVVAAKAAEIARRGGRVLVIAYNTLFLSDYNCIIRAHLYNFICQKVE